MIQDLTRLSAAIAAVPDASTRARILSAVVDVLAKAEVDTTSLTKAEADGYAAGRELARKFNEQGRK